MDEITAAMPQRYWRSREQRLPVDSLGFLLDPEGHPHGPSAPGLVRLADEIDRACLVLLGEPGMGKSTELRSEHERLATATADSGDVLVWRNLGEYGDETRLIRDLFETPEWGAWRAGERAISLYLDALDECHLFLPNVASVLLGRLRSLPRHDRLKIRIACRTGAWPHLLEAGLKQIWPRDRTGVLELAPLRRRDAEAIASGAGVGDVRAFVREVEGRGAGPLAAKPITLRMLANLYARGGRLPRTQAELYERGCRVLCEESSEARRATRWHGTLGVGQRLAVAARIAAATVFCGRSAVWDGPDLDKRPGDDITVPELDGGTESDREVEFAVTEEGVREVLTDTGLFSSLGPRRMGWAHRTFAEYLAARHVSERAWASSRSRAWSCTPTPRVGSCPSSSRRPRGSPGWPRRRSA